MAEDRPDGQPPLTDLIGGIITDAQRLVQQHVSLARREVAENIRKTRNAALLLATGFLAMTLALVLACFALVYLLFWLTNPATEVFPLWACFGSVAVCLAVAGAGLLALARRYAHAVRVLPPQSIEAMKDNLQWTKMQP